MKGLGKRLASLREKTNYSQKELSQTLGFTDNVYGQYERDDRSPTWETLIKLADIYEVSLDYLIRGKETQKENQSNSSEKAIQEISEIIKSKGVMDPHIMNPEKWQKLSYEDIVYLERNFEWVVEQANDMSKTEKTK